MDLQYSVGQLNLLFANSKDAVFFMRKVEDDYEYHYVNEAAIKLIDNNPIGQTICQVIPSHASKVILNAYNAAIEKKEQVEFEDFTYAKREIRKQKTSVIPIEQDDKSYVLAMTREVTVDRDMEDKYLFVRSVFYKTFLTTILVSTDSKFLEANPKFIDEFNISLEDAQNKSFLELPFIDAETVPLLENYMNRAKNGGTVTSKMLCFHDKNNVKRYYMATFSSLTSSDEIFAVFIVLQEITDFVKQGEALRTVSHGLETLKDAISSAADVIFTDLDGVITDVNDRVLNNTGYKREEIIGKTQNIFNSGYHPFEYFKELWKTIKSGEIWRSEVCNRKKSGETYWMDSTIIPMFNENGEIYQFLSVQYNISSEKKLLSELYKIDQTFHAITENTNDFIVVMNHLGEIKYASPSYIRKLGYTEEDLIGQTYDRLLYEDSLPVWQQAIAEYCDLTQLDKTIELQLYSKDGNLIWTEGNYTITLDLANHDFSEIVMVSREITERKEQEEQLKYLAYHDSLTQLANRRYLQKEFPRFVEKAALRNETFAILYLDGDNFKQVNDVYGHDIGDDFLKEFGQALVKSVRSNDVVVRLGGDEFLIVLTGLSTDIELQVLQTEHIVERIQQQLKEGWAIRDVHFTPTSSIGISFYPRHSVIMEELIDLADRALYQVKQLSKNSFKISGIEINV